jgi:hypothetical protein
MAAELGRHLFEFNVCQTMEQLLPSLQMWHNAMGNPTTPTDNTVPTVELVWYDGSTLVNNEGDVISPGGTTTIVVQWEDVAINSATGTLNFEGSAVVDVNDDGAGKVTVTIDASGGTINEGDFISITGGDTINVDLAASNPCLEDDGSGDLRVQVKSDGGLERTSTGVQDKWRYHNAFGTLTADQFPSSGSVGVDNVTSINGETPVGSGADVVTAAGLPLYAANNDRVYLEFTNEGASGILDSWTTDTLANLRPVLAGFPNYDPDVTSVIGHSAGTTDSGQQKFEHFPCPQKVIWGIDPDGGHTITTSGTTLTLTLKVTKYTFDALNNVSAVDEDVEIEYTDGEECS